MATAKNTYILGTYEITYSNNGFVQTKVLISKEAYLLIVRPLELLINTILAITKNKTTSEVLKLKEALDIILNKQEYFVEGSPLHMSVGTGKLVLPGAQGSEHTVNWKMINTPNIIGD